MATRKPLVMTSVPVKRRVAVLVLLLPLACVPHGARIPQLAPLPFAVDTVRVRVVAVGVVHPYLYVPAGPWAVHVLDVDLDRCNAFEALKGAPAAAGRIKTTTM